MDKELEGTDKVMKIHGQSSSFSEEEDNIEEIKVTFQATRAGDSSNAFDFAGPPMASTDSAASDINAKSSPF
jgi:hypothetical protein